MKEPSLDTVYLTDCRELLSKIPAQSCDLVVSSPPYNLGKEYESRVALDRYLATQKEILTACIKALKPTGSLFWQVGAFSDKGALIPLDIRFFPILEQLGMIPRNRIMWIRQHGLHGRKKFSCRHETILWFTKTNDYIFNLDPIRVPQKYKSKKYHTGDKKGELSCHPDGKNPGDIWAFRNVKHNHEERTIHPCQFPEDLVARIILAATNPGGLVLDPYMGAGTVAVVAKALGRHFLGAELDPDYWRVANQRISGIPDGGVFPNLKTLRDYASQVDAPVDDFRYEVQVSRRASSRGKARIYPEEFHLQELERRLAFEEDSFSAELQGEDPPEDPKELSPDPPPPQGHKVTQALTLFD